MAFLDTNGLERLWQHIVAKIGTKADASDVVELQAEIDELADTKASKDVATTSKDGLMSSSDKYKLDNIEVGAQKNTVTGVKGNSESSYRTGNINITAANIGLGNVNNTSDANKPVSTAQQAAIDSAVSTLNTAINGKAAKATTLSGYGITDAYTKTQVDSAVNAKADKATTLSGYGITDAASKEHGHKIADVTGLQSALDAMDDWLVENVRDYAFAIDNHAVYLSSNGISTLAAAPDAGVGANVRGIVVNNELYGFEAAVHNHSAAEITTGSFGVSQGGTGKTTHTSNAILTGNGTSAVKNVSTASGAFYATSANGAAKFGTLPIAQGGTGATSDSAARTNLGVYSKTEVDSKIDAIVGEGASETLDTIGEISAAIEDNQDMLTTLNNAVGGKQDKITGGATTITSSNLTASRALVSDGNGKVAVSAVTSTELGYLDGVTSAIQSQLDSKSADGHKHSASDITSGTLAVGRGGTGLTSSPSMLVNLGSTSAANVLAASPRPGITGTLGLGNGGTGATSASAARTNLSVYSKAEVDEKVNIMTNDMIDAICGASIASENEVTF